ncbi:MAG: hypothetical protein PHU77_02490 [Simplicispira sp.]|nr:hypothetical protein [Simplicispira sp.]
MLGIAGALAGALCHPVAPVLALLAIGSVVAWAAWRPGDVWFMLPALLPMANFTPWTGWWLVDESDLLILAAMGGAYLRWGLGTRAPPPGSWGRTPRSMDWVYGAGPALLLIGVWRGLDDARGALPWAQMLSELWAQGVYGDYDLPGNTLRVAKSLLWGLLLMPVLYRASQNAPVRLARGMVAGLALVCAVVLWERGVYAGLDDFTNQYRTTAWFWEMHVGGGAIDVYLALTLPFAWWAAWTAPQGWRWCAAALLVVLSIYATLTTYSRGLYLTAALALIAVGALAHHYRIFSPDRSVWHRRAMLCLLAALVAETLFVLLGGAFMSDRLAQSNADLYQRMAHWQRGLALLQTPGQWLAGLGAGRLPAHYSTKTLEGALPGQVRWVYSAAGPASVWLTGPAAPEVKGTLALTQRVALEPGGAYRVRLRGHADAPVALSIQLCERHLLYPFQCQWRTTRALGPAQTDGWVDLHLRGPAFASAPMQGARREGVLAITLLPAKNSVRLDAVELLNPQGVQIAKNTDFSLGSRYWGRIADKNYLPWHIDNLFIELLVQHGLVGLGIFAALALHAIVHTVWGIKRQNPLALIVCVSIAAVIFIGGVVSLFEIPRVSIMLWLLLAVSPLCNEKHKFTPVKL